MDDLGGLLAFHALLEDPFEDLVDADVNRAHGAAREMNGWACVLEAFALKPKYLNDVEAARELLRIEAALGLNWENAA